MTEVSRQKSGLMHVVIRVCESGDAELVAVLASRESPGEDMMSDWEWFHAEAGQIGLAELLGLKDCDDLHPGLRLVDGVLWGEQIESPVLGTAYDAGFEVSGNKPLDVQQTWGEWLEATHDRITVEAVYRMLGLGERSLRASARRRLEALAMSLEVLRYMDDEGFLKK